MLPPALDTARLRLPPLAPAHLPLLVRWEQDPVLRDLADDVPAPAPAGEVERTVAAWLRPERPDLLPWAIHRRADGACIGWCMLAAIDRDAHECRAGITIGDRSWWGQGLGREALEAMAAHAFGPLQLGRVIAEVHAFNTRSIRLLEGSGFRLVKTLAGAVRRGADRWDELVYERTPARVT